MVKTVLFGKEALKVSAEVSTPEKCTFYENHSFHEGLGRFSSFWVASGDHFWCFLEHFWGPGRSRDALGPARKPKLMF